MTLLPVQSKEPVSWLRIIQINDVYELDHFPRLLNLIRENRIGRAAPSTTGVATDATSTSTTAGTHSLAESATTNNSFSNALTIVVCAGDFLAPSLLSSLDQGAAMVDCFNALGVTHVSLGNHEADVSLTALGDRILQSNFVWLNTNLPDLDEILLRVSSSSSASTSTASTSTTSAPAQSTGSRVPHCKHQQPPLTTRCDILLVPTLTRPNTTDDSHEHSPSPQPHKRVALLGLLTHDPSLYRPNAFGGAFIRPIVEATNEIQELLLNPHNNQNDPVFRSGDSGGGGPVDLIVPLTHQSIADDRKFASHFGSSGQRSSSSLSSSPYHIPVVCGGHDHEVYHEVVQHCHIVKAGMDAANAAIIDIQWFDNSDNGHSNTTTTTGTTTTKNTDEISSPTVSVQIMSVDDYPPDSEMEKRVEGHQLILKELDRAKLFAISDWMHTSRRRRRHHNQATGSPGRDNDIDDSSDSPTVPLFSTANNRLGPSTGTTALCTMLRMGMRAQCSIINAGAVRGGQVYHPHNKTHFTWSDLKAEMPFSTDMTACYLPGSVLQAAIRHSRLGSRANPPAASGGYLHTCSNIAFATSIPNDSSGSSSSNSDPDQIVSIQGKAFDPDKLFLTALPAQFFGGIDNHQPLLDWAAHELQSTPSTKHGMETRELFNEEAAIPAKMVLVQVFAASMWLQMGGFDDIDTDHDGVICRDEVRSRVAALYGHDAVADLIVDNIFAVADLNGDGTITPLEMMICQFVATDIMDHVCTHQELVAMKEIAAQVLQKDPSHDDVKDMVHKIREAMDQQGDGTINRLEVMNALGALQRSDLLR